MPYCLCIHYCVFTLPTSQSTLDLNYRVGRKNYSSCFLFLLMFVPIHSSVCIASVHSVKVHIHSSVWWGFLLSTKKCQCRSYFRCVFREEILSHPYSVYPSWCISSNRTRVFCWRGWESNPWPSAYQSRSVANYATWPPYDKFYSELFRWIFFSAFLEKYRSEIQRTNSSNNSKREFTQKSKRSWLTFFKGFSW